MKVCYIKYKLVIVSNNNILINNKIENILYNLYMQILVHRFKLLLAILLKTIK